MSEKDLPGGINASGTSTSLVFRNPSYRPCCTAPPTVHASFDTQQTRTTLVQALQGKPATARSTTTCWGRERSVHALRERSRTYASLLIRAQRRTCRTRAPACFRPAIRTVSSGGSTRSPKDRGLPRLSMTCAVVRRAELSEGSGASRASVRKNSSSAARCAAVWAAITRARPAAPTLRRSPSGWLRSRSRTWSAAVDQQDVAARLEQAFRARPRRRR